MTTPTSSAAVGDGPGIDGDLWRAVDLGLFMGFGRDINGRVWTRTAMVVSLVAALASMAIFGFPMELAAIPGL